MAVARYSQYYALAPGSTTLYQPRFAPQNTRPGEIVVIRGAVSFPAGTVATDYGVIAPVVSGLRPVYGQIDATATNGSLTATLGWTASAAAIASLTTQVQSDTATLLTPAQIKAITVLSAGDDNVILTLAGTFNNPTIITVTLALVNCGS